MASSIQVQDHSLPIGQGAAQVFQTPQIDALNQDLRREKYAKNREQALAKRQRDQDLRKEMFDLLSQTKPGPYWITNPHHHKEVTSLRDETIGKISSALNQNTIDASKMPEIYQSIGKLEAAVNRSNMDLDEATKAGALLMEDPSLFSEERANLIKDVLSGEMTAEEARKIDPDYNWRDQVNLFDMDNDFYDRYGEDLITETIQSVRRDPDLRGQAQVTIEASLDRYLEAEEAYIRSSELGGGPGLMKDIQTQMLKKHGIDDPDEAIDFWLQNVVRPLRERQLRTELQRYYPVNPRGGGGSGKQIQDNTDLIPEVKRIVKTVQATQSPDAVINELLPRTNYEAIIEKGKLQFFNKSITATGSLSRSKVKEFDLAETDAIYDFLSQILNIPLEEIQAQPEFDEFKWDFDNNQQFPTITNAEAYNQLPSGSRYIDPDGNVRTKQ